MKLLQNASRLRQIVSVFAKHGFHNILEKAKLGQFILRKITKSEETEKISAAERARLAFEELGPTFVKLGQLLATRPNLIPADFVEEFKKFHDQVTPVAFAEIRQTVETDLGRKIEEVFISFDPEPLAAASIAQVHGARLPSGEEVVVKVQRPGIVRQIKDDLGVLYFIANLVARYVPESKTYNPQGVVDEFFKTLELETNFLVEANNIRKIAQNFADDPTVKIPKVYDAFCTEKVLVMEKLQGFPLSQYRFGDTASMPEGVDPELIVKRGLRAFFMMVFKHGLFHGDLHAGNLFILPENRIGVVDFGIVGRLSPKAKDSVANMLIALASEDYDSLANEYVELAPYNGQINVDQFAKDIRELFAPYYGMTFKNVNLGKLLMDSTGIAARHGVIMPSELMLFFKAVVTVEGMGRVILKDFDLLAHMTEFATEILAARLDPQRFLRELSQFGRDSTALIYSLPRQLRQLMRKLNSRDFALDMHIEEINDLRISIENSGFVIARGLLAAGLFISGTLMLNSDRGPMISGLPVFSLVAFLLAIVVSVFLLQKK